MKTTVHSPETLLHHLLHRATIFLMATSVIITTACENSDDPVVDPVLSNPISLTLQLTPATAQSGAATRIAIGATTFDNDDVLGIYLAHTAGATTEQPITAAIAPLNAKWQNGTYTGDQILYWQNTTDMHTLYAYFPYTASVDAGFKVPATILANQNAATAATDYEAADLLWGKLSTTALQTVSVPMQHCMSEVTVTIAPGSGFAIDEPLPAISKVDLLCADGTTYTYKLAIKDAADEPTDLTATTNHTYTFALKLNKSTLNLTQSTFSVSSWTSGEPIKGGADMDL